MKITKIETNFKRKMFLVSNENIKFKNIKKNPERNLINIYPVVEFQEIIGFGGAFTEAGRLCTF